MSYQIDLRSLPRRDLAVVTFRASVAEIGQKIGPAFGLVHQYLAGAGVPIQGPAVAVYRPSENGFAVSAGFVVPTAIPGDGKVVPAELPACQAAVTTHLGSYGDLPAAYAAIRSWMDEAGHEPSETMWEEYWSDATAPAETTRTDIFWPVKDAARQADRLREPPADRFAGKSHVLDLRSLLARLRAEDHPSKDGHRQITIFHRAPVAHVLFAFEPGGRLEKHEVRGEVTIQVLEGRLVVEAEGRDHVLEAGKVLILSPEVPHDVRASEPSAMLLTVHMSAEKEG